MDAYMSAKNITNEEHQTGKLLLLCLSYHVTSALNNSEQHLTNHFLKHGLVLTLFSMSPV